MKKYEYNKLRGRIVEKYGTQSSFAEKIGISETALSRKMQGKIGISQEDMEKWADLLDIDRKEFPEYFFA